LIEDERDAFAENLLSWLALIERISLAEAIERLA